MAPGYNVRVGGDVTWGRSELRRAGVGLGVNAFMRSTASLSITFGPFKHKAVHHHSECHDPKHESQPCDCVATASASRSELSFD